jgi:homoserine dehydrogenase
MSSPLRLGLAGLGTVGGEVARLLHTQADIFEKRAGRKVELVAISARNRTKKRACDLSNLPWVDSATDLVSRPDVDAVVELMGGGHGAPLQLAEACIKAGKPFITANKALLAEHGTALAALSRQHNAPLYFEAAVAGGIPVIKTLREALAGDHVQEIVGILNGTCNFILSSMAESGRDFSSLLQEAQQLGYAESDASFDVEGTDTAHKLAILSALAFGAALDTKKLNVQGIRAITPTDIAIADQLGYRIKLLGVSKLKPEGLMQHVGPYLVPVKTMLAHVNGVMNAVFIRGDVVGPLALTGYGAGAGPTASAVLSDIIDCACNRRAGAFALAANTAKVSPLALEKTNGTFYLRLMVQDKPGVLADLTGVLRDTAISVKSVLQHGRAENTAVPVVFITHECSEKAFGQALEAFKKLPVVLEPPCMIRILP